MVSPRVIPPSDLMLAGDGSVFHLRMRPSDLADVVIMVGDPGRVELVKGHLDRSEDVAHHREFRSVRGEYGGLPITVLSHGIGCGCIDIVLNELDALANVDLSNRIALENPRSLTLIRIGTAGTLSPHVAAGDAIVTSMAIGLDGLGWYYRATEGLSDSQCANALQEHLAWPSALPTPYAVPSTGHLVERFSHLGHVGMTLSCPGFYAPQARMLRLEPRLNGLLEAARTFTYNRVPLLNLEMESASLTALATALGHWVVTITLAIDNRRQETTLVDYHARMDQLIGSVLAALVR